MQELLEFFILFKNFLVIIIFFLSKTKRIPDSIVDFALLLLKASFIVGVTNHVPFGTLAPITSM